MFKKILFATSVLMLFLPLAFFFKTSGGPRIHYDNKPPVEMPIVQDDPFKDMAHGAAPQEQRDEKFRRWLSVSVKIQVSGASGSGTIVFFNPDDGWAYVQSCGHLWGGRMSAEEGKKKNLKCKVITWYHNDKKLEKPQEYQAEVLYYSNPAPNDCSLVRFKPDWPANYIPIAPADFEFKEGMRLHSCGSDGARESAHYDVRYIGMRGGDLVTTENSPRPGRSGGGLMSDDNYVGICWGTTDRSGNGNGFFTPLATLRKHNEQNGFSWLNDMGANWARQLPIIDRNGPQQQHPKNYIPLPQGKH